MAHFSTFDAELVQEGLGGHSLFLQFDADVVPDQWLRTATDSSGVGEAIVARITGRSLTATDNPAVGQAISRVATLSRSTIDSSSAVSDIIDDFSDISNSTLAMGVGSFDAGGQSFISQGGVLQESKFRLQVTPTSTGNIYSRLYSVSAGLPGTLLATSDPISASSLSVWFTLVTFNFSGANQYNLVAGTQYFITVECSVSTNLGGQYNSTSVHPGFMVAQVTSTGVWFSNAPADFVFFVITGQDRSSAIKGIIRSTGDAPQTSELATIPPTRTTSEALSVLDVSGLNRILQLHSSPSDALVTSESPNGVKGLLRSLTDAPQTSELATRIIPRIRIVSEAVQGTDQSAGLNDGDTPTTWPDSSGNGHTGNYTGAPIIKTGILNGKPVMRFRSASSDGFNLASAISGARPWTFFAVMKQAAPGTFLSSLATGSPGVPFGPLLHSDNNIYIADRSGYSWSVNPSLTAFHVITGHGDPLAGPVIYVDGVLETPINAINLSSTTDFTVIGYNPGFGVFSDGDIAEIVFYDASYAPFGVTRANIEAGLGAKYGLTMAGGTPINPDDSSVVANLKGWWKADSIPISIIGARRIFSGLRSITDAPHTSESPIRLLSSNRNVTDAPVTAEVASKIQGYLRNTTDEAFVMLSPDNNPVVIWPDSSGNGNDATQDTIGLQPAFRNNILKGKPVIRFDGVSDFLQLSGASLDFFKNVAGGTIIVVCNDTNNSGGDLLHNVINFTPGSGTTNIRASIGFTQGLGPAARGRRLDTDSVAATASGVALSGFHVLVATFNWAGNAMTLYIDGVSGTPVGFSSGGGNTDNTPSTNARIGVGGVTANYFPGDISEIIICPGIVLSNTDRQNAEKTLSVKYGTPAPPAGSVIDLTTLPNMRWWKSDSLHVAIRVLDAHRTTPDALTTSEITLRLITFLRSLTDHPFTSESVSKSGPQARTAVDALVIAESVARILVALRSMADSPALSESLVRILSLLRTTTDHPFTAESASALKIKLGVAVDSLLIAESLIRTVLFPRSASDNPSLSESVDRLVTLLRITTDHPFTSESATGLKIKLGAAIDALTVAESVARIAALLRPVSDALSLSEFVSRAVPRSRTTTDALHTAEVIARIVGENRSVVDSLSVSESLARILQASRNGADGLNVSESLLRSGTYIRGTSDHPILFDAAGKILDATRIASEGLIASDANLLSFILNRAGADFMHTAEVARRPNLTRFAFENLLASDWSTWDIPQVIKILVALELLQAIKIVTPQDLLTLQILLAADPTQQIDIVLPEEQLAIDITTQEAPASISARVSNEH